MTTNDSTNNAAAPAALELYATCPSGFEQALAAELRALGCSRVRPLRGSVSFFGDHACALRACLWSRLASRVVLVLDRVGCGSADELYDGVRTIPGRITSARVPRSR